MWWVFFGLNWWFMFCVLISYRCRLVLGSVVVLSWVLLSSLFSVWVRVCGVVMVCVLGVVC